MKIITFLLLLSFAAGAQALRCGTDLVQKGDHITEVRKKCGEPDHQEKWIEDRIIHRRPHRLLPYESTIGSVVITLWTYNFGTRTLMRELRFENGRLVRIETLNYGY